MQAAKRPGALPVSTPTKPGQVTVSKAPAGAVHARDLDMPAEAGKRPVERAGEPWRPVLVADHRRASPLIAAVEKPDAGMIERLRDGGDLRHIGRGRALKPEPRRRIQRREHQARRRRQPGQAVVPQRLRARTVVHGVPDLPARRDLGDRDGGEPDGGGKFRSVISDEPRAGPGTRLPCPLARSRVRSPPPPSRRRAGRPPHVNRVAAGPGKRRNSTWRGNALVSGQDQWRMQAPSKLQELRETS